MQFMSGIKLLPLAFIAIFSACAVEDPSIAEFNLQKIHLAKREHASGSEELIFPFETNFSKPEHHADKQANLFYAMKNGDTIKVSICEFENVVLAKAFFYNSDSISEKSEYLIDGEHKRFLIWGRRVFIFSYTFSISENSAFLDSLVFFTKRFPASAADADMGFQSFSLKNSHADNDISVQREYFLGVEVPFSMLVRRYDDGVFSWFCARSFGKVSEKDWGTFEAERKKNFYYADSTVLINRLQNGIVVAVYGDLTKERMLNIFTEFTKLVKQ